MVHYEKEAEMLVEQLLFFEVKRGVNKIIKQQWWQENKKCPYNPISKQPLKAEREEQPLGESLYNHLVETQ